LRRGHSEAQRIAQRAQRREHSAQRYSISQSTGQRAQRTAQIVDSTEHSEMSTEQRAQSRAQGRKHNTSAQRSIECTARSAHRRAKSVSSAHKPTVSIYLDEHIPVQLVHAGCWDLRFYSNEHWKQQFDHQLLVAFCERLVLHFLHQCSPHVQGFRCRQV
jgi:hypothetical protein